MSILVQSLRNFVPRERDFFTLTDRITESQNHRITESRKDTHVKVLWNRYSFADIPIKLDIILEYKLKYYNIRL